MKYATLYKGLTAKRERCLQAQNKGGWYEKEKAEIEAKYKASLEALEQRYQKSGASHAEEIKALDDMLVILDKLMKPEDDHCPDIAQKHEISKEKHFVDTNNMVADQNAEAAVSSLDGTLADDREPPAFLKREAV